MSTQKWGRVLGVGLWVLIVLEALMMALAGTAKFTRADFWNRMFDTWGYPAGTSYAIGVLETALAFALLVPAATTWAAGLLIGVMAVATVTLLLNPGGMSISGSLMHIGVLVVLAWARRSRRWRPETQTGPEVG